MNILAIAGCKGSGKTTLAQLLHLRCGAHPLAFADPLKALCRSLLGLSYEQVHGSEADKNTPTPYRQHDMPYWPKPTPISPAIDDGSYRYLTAREVMQQMGTEVFRRLDPDIWVKALIRCASSLPSHALIVVHDARFPNECDAIKAVGGRAVLLTRSPSPGADAHASETALDAYGGFDAILDNSALSPEATLQALLPRLDEWGMR